MRSGMLSGELNSAGLAPASSNNRVIAFCPPPMLEFGLGAFPFHSVRIY